jgi:hypothetical protein
MTPTPAAARATAPVDRGYESALKAVVTESGAKRLSALSGVPAEALANHPIADIAARFGHVIDPRWLFMQRVCGKVVRTDAVTGVQLPVPFATVQVQDTDCSLLGYFPAGLQWSWLFPFLCHREVIATTKTDACGNFCVWVPRFDIDWVLRWREERLCFPVVFRRPSLADLIERLKVRLPQRRIDGLVPHHPGDPDPAPDFKQLARAAAGTDSVLSQAFTRLARLPGQSFGESNQALTSALAAPVTLDTPPPLPAEFKGRQAEAKQLARRSIAAQMTLDAGALEGFDPQRWVGPMLRCIDIPVREWVPILDVPDITFRVLQDVNGDGVEEQIYGESHFDVRWNAGTLPFVTLEADATARTAPSCQPSGGVPCGNEPAIVTAGRLPLTGDPGTFDGLEGYGLRTNRPHPGGVSNDAAPRPAAQSPVYGKLSLFGCNRTDKAATHYRLTYRYRAAGNPTYGPSAPFVGISWWLYRLNGVGIGEWFAPTSDTHGWYPIALPAGPNDWLPEDLLLDWPTGGAYPDGAYELVLELGTPGGGATSSSQPVHVVVDNAAPAYTFDIAWRKLGAATWIAVGGDCPVVNRGATPVAVEFRVTLTTTSLHLRNAWLVPVVCGNVGMARSSGSGGADGPLGFEYWHETTGVHGATLEAVYTLPASAHQGTYGFAGRTVSRAFDPGEVVAPPAAAFEYDADRVYLDLSRVFSVFDAN